MRPLSNHLVCIICPRDSSCLYSLYQDKKKGKGQSGQQQPNKREHLPRNTNFPRMERSCYDPPVAADGATVDLSSNGSAVVDISKLTANNQANGSSAAPTSTEQPAASTEASQQPAASKAKKEKEAPASKKSDKKASEPSKAQDATPAAAEQPASKPEEAKAAVEDKPQDKKKEKKSKKAQAEAPADTATKAEEPAAETSQAAEPSKADEESSKKDKRERKRKRKSGAATEEAQPEGEAETSKKANGTASMQVDEQPSAAATETANANEDKSAKKRQKKSRKSETAAEAPVNGTAAATDAPKAANDKDEKSKSKKSRKSVTAAGPAAIADIDPAVVQATAKSLKSVFSMNGVSKRGSDLAAHVKAELEKSEDPVLRAAAVAEGVVHRAILQATKITQSKSGLGVAFEA